MSTARTLTRAEREAALAKMEAELWQKWFNGISSSGQPEEFSEARTQCILDRVILKMAREWHAQLCAAEDAELQRNTCH